MLEQFVRVIRSSIAQLQLFLPRPRRHIVPVSGDSTDTEFFLPSPLSKGASQL